MKNEVFSTFIIDDIRAEPIDLTNWILSASKNFNVSISDFWDLPLFMVTGFFKTMRADTETKGNRKVIVDQIRAARELFGWV